MKFRNVSKLTRSFPIPLDIVRGDLSHWIDLFKWYSTSCRSTRSSLNTARELNSVVTPSMHSFVQVFLHFVQASAGFSILSEIWPSVIKLVCSDENCDLVGASETRSILPDIWTQWCFRSSNSFVQMSFDISPKHLKPSGFCPRFNSVIG